MLPRRYFILVMAGMFGLSMTTADAHASGNVREAGLENLLIQDCGSCHGLTMKGGLGPALLPENIVERDDDFLADIIMEGVPGTPMPPWKFLINRDEALWMVRKLKQGLKP